MNKKEAIAVEMITAMAFILTKIRKKSGMVAG